MFLYKVKYYGVGGGDCGVGNEAEITGVKEEEEEEMVEAQ